MSQFVVDFKAIAEFLKLENLPQNIHQLLIEYVEKDKDACVNLLSWIPNITSFEFAKRNQQSQHRLDGIEQLIHIYDRKNFSDNEFVICTVIAIMEYFPRGTCEHGSEIGKRFFFKFVDCLKRSTNLIDSTWAKSTMECNDYLKLVLQKNK
jgi:hypothetical protein